MLYDKRKTTQVEATGYFGRLYMKTVVNCYVKNCTSYTITKMPRGFMRAVGDAIVRAMGYRGVECKCLVTNIKGPQLIIHFVKPL